MANTSSITTADQLLHAGDIGPCELIQGELIMMSPAGGEHGIVTAAVARHLLDHVKRGGLGVVYGAETGFLIATGPDTVLAPDCAFVRRVRVAKSRSKGFVPGPPDLAIEVLSPGDRTAEVMAKVARWRGAGCITVWVIDPAARTVAVHDSSGCQTLAEGQSLGGGELVPGLEVPVAALFEDLS